MDVIPVPLTTGSRTSRSLGLEGFTVTEAWFPAGTYLSAHTHDRANVAVMLDGSFELEMGGRVHYSPPSAVFVEPAGESHANRMGVKGARVVVIQPDPAATELLRPFARMLERTSHRYHAGVAGRAQRLTAELGRPDDLAPLAAEAGVLEMLVMLARLDLDDGRGAPPWLLRAQEVVHDRFREPLRAADVAHAADVHPAHLARAFRSHFKLSMGAYVRRLRLEWAAAELGRPERTLAGVALAAGFADQSHFTRAFKAYAGLTPDVYRRARLDNERPGPRPPGKSPGGRALE